MAQDKEGDLVGGTFDPKALPGLGAERTTEEVVADIVAKDPAAHGVTLEERKRRARAQALDLSNLSADDALIVSIGGDPDETMGGNRPRWTVDGDTIKDHVTGKEWGVIAVRGRDDPDGQP